MTYRAETMIALETAHEVGVYLLEAFKRCEHTDLRGSVKGAVTKYDAEADAMIRDRLHKAYPKDVLMTEEGVSPDHGLGKRRWIVDSIDGTVNFAAGNPLWSILLALEEDGTVTLGVMHAPAAGETYVAEKGKGVFLNDEPITVSTTDELADSYVYVCEGAVENRDKTAALMNALYPNVQDLRKIGSAGFEMAWVAAGRADGYSTTQIDPWDVAPGVLMVEEAGGRVTTFDGDPWTPETHDIVASNGHLHDELLRRVNEHI